MISFQKLPAGLMHPEALAFYNAMNACEKITGQPHLDGLELRCDLNESSLDYLSCPGLQRIASFH